LAYDEISTGKIILIGSKQFRVENFVPVPDKLRMYLDDRLSEYK